MNKKKSFFSKSIKITIGVAVMVLVLIGGWWAYGNLMPHPLGDKMEYLGKKSFGCDLVFCVAKPSWNYYYGTDMTSEEVKTYFTKADYRDIPHDLGGVSESSSFDNLHFNSRTGDFTLQYYRSEDVDTITKAKQLPSTKKKAIVSLSDSDYKIAEKTL